MVGRVKVVEIEIVGTQPLQAFIKSAQNRLAQKPLLIRRVANLEKHLAGNDQPIAFALDGMAQHGLRRAIWYMFAVSKKLIPASMQRLTNCVAPAWSRGLPNVIVPKQKRETSRSVFLELDLRNSHGCALSIVDPG